MPNRTLFSIFIPMNNLGLKLCKEIGHVSVRVQELFNAPEDKFENTQKEKWYNYSKGYHKNQHGLIRISKYEYYETDHNNQILLKKHNIRIFTNNQNYDYAEPGNENERIWYMNFANADIFMERDSHEFSMEDEMVIDMPLLYKSAEYLESNPECGITRASTYRDEEKYYYPTPILIENIPQWGEYKSSKFTPVEKDKFNNIVCIRPPFGMKETYSEGSLKFLVVSLIAGFGGIQKQGQKNKKTRTVLHTGNWGCGNLKNNKELVYLAQMFIADAMGIDELWFHLPDETIVKNAFEKYKALPEGMVLADFVSYLAEQNYHKE